MGVGCDQSTRPLTGEYRLRAHVARNQVTSSRLQDFVTSGFRDEISQPSPAGSNFFRTAAHLPLRRESGHRPSRCIGPKTLCYRDTLLFGHEISPNA